MCGKPCYESHTVMPGGVPKYEHSSTLTPVTLANLSSIKGSSCSSTILSSTRGMSFQAQFEECHMLNPYPELNSRDTSPSAAHEAPGVAASRSSGRGRVPPGASRLKCSLFCTYHLAESSLSPGVTCAGCPLNHRYRLAG
ncbi:hypothetical protein DEO72_LG5g1667 [Vigna unguiculata]|uniref:Uncharacterized protein n=1 Tax=Vigna unguiculata TaxID=3917 RepID=A0A4D6LXG9_VIGUN|nr:hypothetical protein DEO72_LG5g1667 [Vigna unguiculata]